MTEAPTYAHTLESCPSKHWNDGSDVCADCGADLNLPLGAPDALAEAFADGFEAFAYPSPGDTVATEDGPAKVDSLDTSRGADFAPIVILIGEMGEAATYTRRTEAAFLIRTGPSSWRERLPRAGTTGGAAPDQVLEVGDVFHGAPLPSEPLPMYWSPDLSALPGGACLVIDAAPDREQALVLDVLFYDRAQGDALRPIIMEAAQRIMMQPAEAIDETPGAESYALRFPLEHKATATRAYSDGYQDGAGDMTLSDLEGQPVYIVQGDHWSVPGRPLFVCATEDAAKAKALELVNGMLGEVSLPPADDHEEGLTRLKAKVEEDFGEGDGVDVWITTTEMGA